MKRIDAPAQVIPNAHYEALLRMWEKNPNAFRVLSPNTKLAVLYYEAAKRQAQVERAANSTRRFTN